jgi:hypothetical protein
MVRLRGSAMSFFGCRRPIVRPANQPPDDLQLDFVAQPEDQHGAADRVPEGRTARFVNDGTLPGDARHSAKASIPKH